MIYAITKPKKEYLLEVIYKFDTDIQSEVELIMTHMNYGCTDYNLCFDLKEVKEIMSTMMVIEIKLPYTMVAEEILTNEKKTI